MPACASLALHSNSARSMASGDRIAAPFPFFIDDFMADCIEMKPAVKWHYFHLLTYLWKHGSVRNDDRALARAMDLKPVGNYAETVRYVRVWLCFHPTKEGFLTQSRLHDDREKHLKRKASSRNRVNKHRAMKRVTENGVTRSYSSPYPYKRDSQNDLFETQTRKGRSKADQSVDVAKSAGRALRAPAANADRDDVIRRKLIDAVGENTVIEAERGVQWAIDKCTSASRLNRIGWFPKGQGK